MTQTATLTKNDGDKLRVIVIAKVEFDGNDWWYRVCKETATNRANTFQVRGDRLEFDK